MFIATMEFDVMFLPAEIYSESFLLFVELIFDEIIYLEICQHIPRYETSFLKSVLGRWKELVRVSLSKSLMNCVIKLQTCELISHFSDALQ